VSFLRSEETFGSVERLTRQMAVDVQDARRKLAQKKIKETLYTFCASHYSPATKQR